MWPEALECQPELVATLATECLSPLGFYMLQSRLRTQVGPRGELMATGREGEEFTYGDEMERSACQHEHDVHEWIGWPRP